jgi:hypothetical protein
MPMRDRSTKRTREWRELSARQRGVVLLAAVVQFALLIAALRDLRRRPSGQINGNKGVWVAVSFVNFIGPLSYFLFGRRRPT